MMRVQLVVAAILLLVASTNADSLRHLTAGKTTKPCVWMEGAVKKGCYFSDTLLFEGVSPKKITTWQAKTYYDWITYNSKTIQCSDNKDKKTCVADKDFPCVWFPAGGNRITLPGKPSCDIHPLMTEYKYYLAIQSACRGSLAAFDGKCAIYGRTKKSCTKITANGVPCEWKVKADGTPVRSFPCGVPGSALKKLTSSQKKLVPSLIEDQYVFTASKKDFEAVYGKCPKSKVAFQNQVCGTLEATACKISKWCTYDSVEKDCDNSAKWWFKNGLGGDAYITKVLSDVQQGCSSKTTANDCASFEYTP